MTGFYLEDDCADESDTTQRNKFRARARQQVEMLLLPELSAAEQAIQRVLDEQVGRLLRDNGEIVIRYEPFRKCSVQKTPTADGPAHSEA